MASQSGPLVDSSEDYCQLPAGAPHVQAVSRSWSRGSTMLLASLFAVVVFTPALAMRQPWKSERLPVELNAEDNIQPSRAFDFAAGHAACNHDPGGSCRIFDCDASRGLTRCVDGHCECIDGTCVEAGVCEVPECNHNPGGSCRFFACDSSRGLTQCVDGRCECMDGTCVDGGVCLAPQSTCSQNTGYTCRMFNCNWKRGPTECDDAKCLCPHGYCSEDGYCVQAAATLHERFRANVVKVDQDHPTFPGPHGAVQSALCISGGGSRSLSIALGAYRALTALDMMGHFDAISAVSGGAWASSIYMFADREETDLLGAATSPETLDMATLQSAPSVLGSVATNLMGPFVRQLARNPIGAQMDDLWEEFIGETILEPVGLASRTRFMAANAEHRDSIMQRNPHLNLRHDDFLLPQPGRPPVFVMGGTLLSPVGYRDDGASAVSLQMSPDYSGSPFYPDNGRVVFQPTADSVSWESIQNSAIGGGFVESFAFGSGAPSASSQQGGPAGSPASGRSVVREQRFTLLKAVSISSAAYAASLARFVVMQHADPEITYWPVTPDDNGQAEMRYKAGDGGNTDDSGMLAMLQRRASKVVWLLNTDTGITDGTTLDFCDVANAAASPVGHCTNQLYDKFGFATDSASDFIARNQVFQAEELAPVLCAMQRLKSQGRPVVHRQSFEVQANAHWGISGGFNVEIVFVYNEECQNFYNLLPEGTRQQIDQGFSGAFGNFPHYNTVHENSAEFTSLTNEQVNLLAAFSEYAVLTNADIFREVLTGR